MATNETPSKFVRSTTNNDTTTINIIENEFDICCNFSHKHVSFKNVTFHHIATCRDDAPFGEYRRTLLIKSNMPKYAYFQ